MSDLLIKGGRVIDPANGLDAVMDVLIERGRIARVGRKLESDAKRVIDAKGLWVTPGLVDMHVHLREPGYEYKETIASGSAAAAAGGFTSVACMANTNPVNDCGQITEFIVETARREAVVNVFPVGACTMGLKGEALANIGEMAAAGAVALSDDGRCAMNAQVMRKAMEYGAMFNLTTLVHAEDHNLTQGGVMNEGAISAALGLRGQPAAAEEAIIARDIQIAEYLKLPVHFCHVSTAGAVELVRRAKERGVKVTAEAAPHHFTLTDETCRDYNTNAKMAPPLRTRADMEALRAGIADGTMDAIATDHAPHSVIEKEVEFDQAAYGIVGLETALPLALALVGGAGVAPARLIESLTARPAAILGIERGTLPENAPADVTIIDPEREWTVNPALFKSKGRNTPFGGWTVRGRAMFTIVGGKIVHELKEQQA